MEKFKDEIGKQIDLMESEVEQGFYESTEEFLKACGWLDCLYFVLELADKYDK